MLLKSSAALATAAAALLLIGVGAEQAAARDGGRGGGGGGPSVRSGGGGGGGTSFGGGGGSRSFSGGGGRNFGGGGVGRSFGGSRHFGTHGDSFRGNRGPRFAVPKDGVRSPRAYRHSHRGRHRHFRRRGGVIVYGAPYYYGSYGYDACAYYYNRAIATNSPYWWNLYYDCVGYW